MKEINGLQNEHFFSKYLNGSRIKFLTPIFQDFMFRLYGKLSDDTIIKCKVDYEKKSMI